MVRFTHIIALVYYLVLTSCTTVAQITDSIIETRANEILSYKNYLSEKPKITENPTIGIKLSKGLILDLNIFPKYLYQQIDEDISNKLTNIDFINGWELSKKPDTLETDEGIKIMKRDKLEVISTFKHKYEIDKFLNVYDEYEENIGYLVLVSAKENGKERLIKELFFLKKTNSKITSIVTIALHVYKIGHEPLKLKTQYLGNSEFYSFDQEKFIYFDEEGKRVDKEEKIYTRFTFDKDGKVKLISD